MKSGNIFDVTMHGQIFTDERIQSRAIKRENLLAKKKLSRLRRAHALLVHQIRLMEGETLYAKDVEI